VKSYRPTPALVVSVFALVIAMGGSAVAVSASISGSTIKEHSIPANRIKSNSLTGTQINENKLKTVPSAQKVDGITMRKVFRVLPAGSGEITIATFGRLQVKFGCDDASIHTQLDVASTFTTGDATSEITQGDETFTNDNDDFVKADQLNLTNDSADARTNGNLTVAWNDGHYSDFHFTDDDPNIFNNVDSCVVAGLITFG
jgi:hypothetical protein